MLRHVAERPFLRAPGTQIRTHDEMPEKDMLVAHTARPAGGSGGLGLLTRRLHAVAATLFGAA